MGETSQRHQRETKGTMKKNNNRVKIVELSEQYFKDNKEWQQKMNRDRYKKLSEEESKKESVCETSTGTCLKKAKKRILKKC